MAHLDTDQPKNTFQEDRFKRYDFARRIARIIKNNQINQSLVIGIYGKWGEGKTSVMNFIKAELPLDTVVINFNPWIFSDQEQLVKSFLSSIAFELGETLSSDKEKIGKVLQEYGEVVGSVTKYLGLPLDGFKEIGEKLQTVSIEKLKLRVDDMIRSTDKRMVVCVDDIDRLDVKEIQYIFKLVKLVGDFPNTSYLLAFDDDLIADALAPQYGDKNKKNGYLFLEKIIQLPLKIPKATRSALKKYTLDKLDKVLEQLEVQIDQKDVHKFRELFDDCFVPHIDNPRLAIRYSNAVYFALPMLYGEVSTVDLMLVEGLKVFFPLAYDFTRYNSSLFLTDTTNEYHNSISRTKTRDQVVKETSAFLTELRDKDSDAVRSIWQALFPQYTFAIGKRGYSNNKWMTWYKEKRICSGTYFDRYFTYVVQENEISDVQFEQFLSDLETKTIEDARIRMDIFLKENDLADVVFKLRLWEKDLSAKQSRDLSVLFATKSNELPIEPGEFATFTTQAQVARIVAQLINNLPPNERSEHSKLVLLESESFEFAMEVVYHLFHKEGKLSYDTLTEREQAEIQNLLVDHFKSLFTGDNFFKILPDTKAWRILSWWKVVDPAGLQNILNLALSNTTANVFKVIRVFTPTITSWGGKETRIYKSDFRKENYDSLAKAVDVRALYEILINDEHFERVDFDLQQVPDRDALSDIDLASIFMLFYEEKNGVSDVC